LFATPPVGLVFDRKINDEGRDADVIVIASTRESEVTDVEGMADI
jgi:hypothetical protein